MHSTVVVSDVSFELPNGHVLFEDLSFSLDHRRTALVGPNGVGKTSLAKLLVNELEPTKGMIHRCASITLLHQWQILPEVSVDEFLTTGYNRSILSERLLRGIHHQKLCTQLSGGEWMRLRLARVLGESFLILDEPTNDLDREGREVLMQFLKDHQSGVLLISHDRECLQMCENILELSNQGLTKFSGDWSAYEEMQMIERDRRKFLLEKAKHHRDKAFVERVKQNAQQEKRNRRGSKVAARGGLPKILLGARKRQAQVTAGQINAETLERAHQAVHEAHEAFAQLKMDPAMYAELLGYEIPSQKLVAEAHGFNIRFQADQSWIYPEDLQFTWRGGVRVALKGCNGSGKSTLLKAIMGDAYFQTRGELRRGSLATLYLDQQCNLLDNAKSIFENVRENSHLSESETRNGLAKFLFVKDRVFQTVQSLSGGERLRAALAKSFLGSEKPELLILDEPTNNLDLTNITFLENLIRQFRGALIIVSHDNIFLRNCNVMETLELGSQ